MRSVWQKGGIRKVQVVAKLSLVFILLILSSCTARNNIENFLGLPITKSLNKAKTTFSSCSAQIDEFYLSVASGEQIEIKFQPASLKLFSKQLNVVFANLFKCFASCTVFKTSKTPIYIWLKQLKIDL